MNAANKPSSLPSAPMLQAGLAELFRMGMIVAGVSARLAEIESRALGVLAEAADAATRGLMAAPDSLEAANEAGRVADASDATRDIVVARMAVITNTFNHAARGVRRTADLIRRLDQPVRASPSERDAGVPAKPRAPSPELPDGSDGVERPRDDERLDEREVYDELGDRSAEAIIGDICRDLGLRLTPAEAGPLPPSTVAAVRAACARAAGSAAGGAPEVGEAGAWKAGVGAWPPREPET